MNIWTSSKLRPIAVLVAPCLSLACGQAAPTDPLLDTETSGAIPPGASSDGTGGGAPTTTASPGNDGTSPTPTGEDDDDGSIPEPPVIFDVGGVPEDSGGCLGAAPTDATLTGTVFAPNLEIPISGAVVYTSVDEPPGIPQNVYCPSCQPLGCDDNFTFTAADGTFSLDTVSGDDRWLVVQKGQFMRVTPIDVAVGNAVLAAEITSLPGYNDPDAGLYVPLIAIADASYDRLEDALGKFGLGDTMISNLEEQLVPGTEAFDLWDNGRNPTTDGFTSQGTFAQLVSDPERLDDYHIIFVPCSSDGYLSALDDPQNVQNIRDWVAAGGRWYVADWANEWMEHVFPDYQTLSGEPDNADLGSYDSMSNVLDPGLLEWLEALPEPLKDINPLNDESHPTLFELPQVLTVDNWSAITATPPVLVDDGMGGQVDVGHKTWLEGPGGSGAAGVHPLTITGQYGCGKIQFTSYHAAEFFDYVGLSPQELVLIYTILEIGVCQDPLPPPQG
jgi:hypothetical protein